MGTLHCALENGADLYVNERHKIRNYCAMSAEERKRRSQIANFFLHTVQGRIQGGAWGAVAPPSASGV